jgi:hypothetical protein
MLQIVQRVLARVDADNVTTIGETVESEQVADFVKTVYEDIMTDFTWYHKRSHINLEVTATAHIMRIPTEVDQLLSDVIYYGDKEVYWIEPETMQYKLKNRDTSLSRIDSNGAINDTDPSYWSSFDDDNIVFDSYNSSLVAASTSVWAATEPASPAADIDIPDMPHSLHIALLFGTMAMALDALKGDGVGARGFESKKIKKIAKAKRYGRRVGKEYSPGKKVDFGRRHIRWSNERDTNTIVEGT